MDWALNTGLSVGAGTWPSANRAIYTPITIEAPVTAYHMGFEVVTQSGNVDVGLYDLNGVLLISSGTTAVGATGFQGINITDTPLNPGIYFMAMAVDNTTASLRRYATAITLGSLSVQGIQDEDTAFVLPATATMSAMGAQYIPMLYVSLASTF